MARTVAEIEFASRSMINLVNEEIAEGKFIADYVIPLPWREAKLAPKLKIGYWVDDGLVKTSPACARAVHESVAKLRELGHEVSEFRPPVPSMCNDGVALTFSLAGSQDLLGAQLGRGVQAAA